MKKITTTLLTVLTTISFSFGQTKAPIPMVDKKVNYSEVVTVDSSSKKDVLYGKSKLWFANTFKSSNNVVQLDDKENGIILGKGTIIKNEVKGLTNIRKTWNFTIKIQVKDGKYKAEIYDINYIWEMPGNTIGQAPSYINLDDYFNNPKVYKSDGTTLKDQAANFANETNDNMNALLISIKKTMTETLKSDF